MSTPIKPCPFCGADGVAEPVGFANYKVVRCAVCVASGPSCDTVEQAIAAWNTAPRTPSAPPANTVRVRVAVSVSNEGLWGAAGGSSSEFDPVETLRETGDYTDAHRLTWITADVPKPDPAAEIEAEIDNP